MVSEWKIDIKIVITKLFGYKLVYGTQTLGEWIVFLDRRAESEFKCKKNIMRKWVKSYGDLKLQNFHIFSIPKHVISKD